MKLSLTPAPVYNFADFREEKLTLLRLPIFSASDIALLFGVALPTLFFHIVLSVYRLFHADMEITLASFVSAVGSDFLFHAAIFGVLLGIYGFIRYSSFKVLFFLFVQFVAIFLNVVQISAHDYFLSTGAELDYRLMAYSLENYAEISKVVSSKVTLATKLMYGLSVGGSILLPIILFFLFRKRKKTATINKKKRVVFFIIAAFSYFAITFPRGANSYDESLFSQNPVYRFILSYLDEKEAGENLVEDGKMPTDTYLIKKKGRKNKNIVFIILESVNAKSTSIYSKKWDTTPFLRKLARKSLVANRAYTVTPHTSKALVAIHCGYPGRPYMKIIEAEKGGLPLKCLPHLLKEQKYKTAFFQSPTEEFENRRGLVKNMGFDKFYPMEKLPRDKFEPVNFLGWEDDIMLDPARKWLKKYKKKGKKAKGFMLTFLTNTTHWEYNVPETFPKKKFKTRSDYADYLNTIRYADRFVSKLIQIFKDENLYKNTIFVILGDHGEGFYEHGLSFHNLVMYEEGIHIPLFIHYPGKFKKGYEVDRVVSQIDILPTVLSMSGFKVRGGKYPGIHLLKPVENRFVYTNCWQDKLCVTLTGKRYKYIYHFQRKRAELYDLYADPLEKNNLIAQTTLADSLKQLALKHYFQLEKTYQIYTGIPGFLKQTNP